MREIKNPLHRPTFGLRALARPAGDKKTPYKHITRNGGILQWKKY